MIDLEIEEMRMTDLDDIMEIEQASFSAPWSRWMFERELEDKGNSLFLVARIGVELVGYIGLWIALDEAHIVTIAVRDNFRRKGVGSMLMVSALNAAVSLGADKATLEVRVTNTPALELYEKFGFETVAIRRGFYSDTGEDAFVMWLHDLKDKIGEIRALVWRIQRGQGRKV